MFSAAEGFHKILGMELGNHWQWHKLKQKAFRATRTFRILGKSERSYFSIYLQQRKDSQFTRKQPATIHTVSSDWYMKQKGYVLVGFYKYNIISLGIYTPFHFSAASIDVSAAKFSHTKKKEWENSCSREVKWCISLLDISNVFVNKLVEIGVRSFMHRVSYQAY